MATIQEKQRWRSELLRTLYDEVDGVPQLQDVDYRTLGPKLGLEEAELRNAVQWLVDRVGRVDGARWEPRNHARRRQRR